jgi:hypothetical protein
VVVGFNYITAILGSRIRPSQQLKYIRASAAPKYLCFWQSTNHLWVIDSRLLSWATIGELCQQYNSPLACLHFRLLDLCFRTPLPLPWVHSSSCQNVRSLGFCSVTSSPMAHCWRHRHSSKPGIPDCQMGLGNPQTKEFPTRTAHHSRSW